MKNGTWISCPLGASAPSPRPPYHPLTASRTITRISISNRGKTCWRQALSFSEILRRRCQFGMQEALTSNPPSFLSEQAYLSASASWAHLPHVSRIQHRERSCCWTRSEGNELRNFQAQQNEKSKNKKRQKIYASERWPTNVVDVLGSETLSLKRSCWRSGKAVACGTDRREPKLSKFLGF